jgi:hypothetical protein
LCYLECLGGGIMYRLTIKYDAHDVKMKFKSIYDLEVFLDVNNLPMLCLETIKNIRKKGEISCATNNGGALTVTYESDY